MTSPKAYLILVLLCAAPSLEKRCRAYYTFKGVDDHEEYTAIFDPIIQS